MSESSLFYNNLGTFDIAIFASYGDDIQSLAEFGRIYLQRILSSRNSGTVNRPTTCIMYCYYSIIAFIAAQLYGKCFVTTDQRRMHVCFYWFSYLLDTARVGIDAVIIMIYSII